MKNWDKLAWKGWREKASKKNPNRKKPRWRLTSLISLKTTMSKWLTKMPTKMMKSGTRMRGTMQTHTEMRKMIFTLKWRNSKRSRKNFRLAWLIWKSYLTLTMNVLIKVEIQFFSMIWRSRRFHKLLVISTDGCLKIWGPSSTIKETKFLFTRVSTWKISTTDLDFWLTERRSYPKSMKFPWTRKCKKPIQYYWPMEQKQ